MRTAILVAGFQAQLDTMYTASEQQYLLLGFKPNWTLCTLHQNSSTRCWVSSPTGHYIH